MDITLDIRKSLEKNASAYFEKAKKDKKKLEGAKKTVETYKKKLSSLKEERIEEKTIVKKKAKKEWYEKFRWFISSDGYLVIGGRDATTNEIVIKKYAEKNDLVFHTDMAGSPFVVIKNKEGKETSKSKILSYRKPERFSEFKNQRFLYAKDKSLSIPETTISEAAIFTAVFSRAWKQGFSTLAVFSVKPEQVSKKARPGEYLAKGAFMIYGDTTYYHPEMNYAVGVYENKVMGGPLSAIKKNCKDFVEIEQGNEKLSDVAKLVKKKISGELDDILRVLPAGSKVKK